jgi:hypothetical protein
MAAVPWLQPLLFEIFMKGASKNMGFARASQQNPL